MPALEVPPIYQLLAPERVRVGLAGRTKQGVIHELVETLAAHPAVEDLDQVREAVLRREEVFSTGVGKGLGLPHAKSQGITASLAAFAVTAEPIPFGSIDDEPVQLVFLLVGPEHATSRHIKILSRLSRLMNRDAFREQLLAAKTPHEVVRIFEEGELALIEH